MHKSLKLFINLAPVCCHSNRTTSWGLTFQWVIVCNCIINELHGLAPTQVVFASLGSPRYVWKVQRKYGAVVDSFSNLRARFYKQKTKANL